MIESSGDSAAGLRAEIEVLEEQVARLQRALESRIVIEQAKGAVSVRSAVTPNEAFKLLRATARKERRKLGELCAEVIENEGRLDGLPRSNGRVPLGLRIAGGG